jgi:hypothetical protein
MTPMNMMDIDDSMSKGEVDGQTMMDEVEKKFTEPYDKAKAEGLWYAYMEKSFPGIPGRMIEQKLQEAGKAQYDQTKKAFIDALLKGGKNGTV